MPASQKTAVLFLISTALLWSTAGFLIKWIDWPPLAIAGGRSAIAGLVILLYLRKVPRTWSWPMAAGAVSYAATVTLFVCATKLTTAANAILLQYTAPVYTAVLGAWLLGERTKKSDWIMIAITLGGMTLFFMDRLSASGLWGNVCSIASGLTFACLILFMRRQKDAQPEHSVFWGNVLAALIGLPAMLSGGMPSPQGLAGLFMLGIFQLGLAYILYAKAIRTVTALNAVLIPMIEPVLNPLWVFLLVHEKPGPWALAGGCIVFLSVSAKCIMASRK